MKFAFTVKLQNRFGGTAQLILGEHPATSVAELAHELNSRDFIVITQLDNSDARGNPPIGELILGCAAIIKARETRKGNAPGQPIDE